MTSMEEAGGRSPPPLRIIKSNYPSSFSSTPPPTKPSQSPLHFSLPNNSKISSSEDFALPDGETSPRSPPPAPPPSPAPPTLTISPTPHRPKPQPGSVGSFQSSSFSSSDSKSPAPRFSSSSSFSNPSSSLLPGDDSTERGDPSSAPSSPLQEFPSPPPAPPPSPPLILTEADDNEVRKRKNSVGGKKRKGSRVKEQPKLDEKKEEKE